MDNFFGIMQVLLYRATNHGALKFALNQSRMKSNRAEATFSLSGSDKSS